MFVCIIDVMYVWMIMVHKMIYFVAGYGRRWCNEVEQEGSQRRRSVAHEYEKFRGSPNN